MPTSSDETQPDDVVPATVAFGGDTMPPATGGRAAEASPAEQSRRSNDFGDYELLNEVARGGMGVVFRARQKSLHRTVAVKMILAGQLASDDAIRRFYSEAEAAAQLDHSGIVPIYEVGEQAGRHFFSMAYIDGPSLHARLAKGPLPPREAAQVVMRVAEAVAYAHTAGIIHRDLKPHNILLDRDGTPKVTDFGLAKRLGDEGLTTTGEILGTPGYMSPEQAGGKVRELGPLVDVYALGAILYAALTGRPPFQAANAMDTLLQVLDDAPPPPQLLNSLVPTDLQSICLQCLEKDPKRRYASASELAADLQRWLDGELVQASGQTWRAALVRTLSRSRDDVKLRTWGTMLIAFAAITFLAEVGIYLHALGGPPYPYHWALVVRALQFVAMATVFALNRAAWRTTAAATAEHMWSLWLSFIIGCCLTAVIVVELHTVIMPGTPLEILAAYPYFCISSGMLFIALGRSFWGYCYAFGGLFLALGLVLPFVLPYAPLIFGTTWGVLLLLLGMRLRGLRAES
jgi:serine/threonine-protein kinase